MRTRILAPGGVAVPRRSLHYAVSVRGRALQSRDPAAVEFDEGGSVTVDFAFRNGPVAVDLEVWADMDDDGERSEGDLVGRFDAPFTVETQPACGPDFSRSPDIALEPWISGGPSVEADGEVLRRAQGD